MSNLELVKKIRQITGAGMSDINKALAEANGDENKTIEILRKSGSKIAAKKADRQIKEGAIAIARDDKKIAVVALGCETDFVARNQDFVQTVQDLAAELLRQGKDNFQTWATDKIQNDLIVKIGENLQLANFALLEGEIMDSYVHSNRKVAAVVILKGGSQELAKDIAMHVAAMAPKYLKPEDVPDDIVSKEKEIYTEQLKNEGKPEAMWEKILPGKLAKFYSEICLLKQIYIKDDKKTIEQLLQDNDASLEKYYYFSL
ncbi:MAG: translation elongation factor Ts [Patescibacteria group bacterium]